MMPMLPAMEVMTVRPFFARKFRALSPKEVENAIAAFSEPAFSFSSFRFFHAFACASVIPFFLSRASNSRRSCALS